MSCKSKDMSEKTKQVMAEKQVGDKEMAKPKPGSNSSERPGSGAT